MDKNGRRCIMQRRLCIALQSEIFAIFRNDGCVPVGGILQSTLLGTVIHMDETESLS